jgi:hypothetical protein
MEKKSSKWIQKAIKKPGSLTATAKKAGELTKKGDIKDSWVDKVASNKKGKYSAKTEKRAELAKTLGKMRKKK